MSATMPSVREAAWRRLWGTERARRTDANHRHRAQTLRARNSALPCVRRHDRTARSSGSGRPSRRSNGGADLRAAVSLSTWSDLRAAASLSTWRAAASLSTWSQGRPARRQPRGCFKECAPHTGGQRRGFMGGSALRQVRTRIFSAKLSRHHGMRMTLTDQCTLMLPVLYHQFNDHGGRTPCACPAAVSLSESAEACGCACAHRRPLSSARRYAGSDTNSSKIISISHYSRS